MPCHDITIVAFPRRSCEGMSEHEVRIWSRMDGGLCRQWTISSLVIPRVWTNKGPRDPLSIHGYRSTATTSRGLLYILHPPNSYSGFVIDIDMILALA